MTETGRRDRLRARGRTPLATGALLTLALLTACAGSSGRDEFRSSPSASRIAVVRAARAQIGAPYRWGGDSPRGFDCSGLVVYSYAAGGVSGLPRSAAELERIADRVDLDELEPGDLLFFRWGLKTSHVGIYVGQHEFVHAPSSGKHVEKVRFDDPYWGSRLRRAGRILR